MPLRTVLAFYPNFCLYMLSLKMVPNYDMYTLLTNWNMIYTPGVKGVWKFKEQIGFVFCKFEIASKFNNPSPTNYLCTLFS